MRTVLSEQAVATIGRCGWGEVSQARALQDGVKVASGVMEGILRYTSIARVCAILCSESIETRIGL